MMLSISSCVVTNKPLKVPMRPQYHLNSTRILLIAFVLIFFLHPACLGWGLLLREVSGQLLQTIAGAVEFLLCHTNRVTLVFVVGQLYRSCQLLASLAELFDGVTGTTRHVESFKYRVCVRVMQLNIFKEGTSEGRVLQLRFLTISRGREIFGVRVHILVSYTIASTEIIGGTGASSH